MRKLFLFFCFNLLFITNAYADDDFLKIDFFKRNKPVKLENFLGKPTILMFYATWCGYCEEELPQLANLKRVIDNNKVNIIPVSVDEDTEQNIKIFFRRKNASNLPVYIDKSGDLFKAFGLKTIPNFFLISSEGKILKNFISLEDMDADILEAEMSKNETATQK